jgi:diacylglycerol kinase family enzyme
MAGDPMTNTDTDADYRTRKHLFIINPVSFKAEKDMGVFVTMVKNQFVRIVKEECEIRVSRFPRHAIRMARQYITQAGPETVVRVYAVGGDGILFDCLNGIVGLPNAELAPIPYGRTNYFVRSFGDNLEDSFRDIPRLAMAPAISTDILHCGSNYALNNCTLGLESAVIFQTVEMRKNLKNWTRFIRDNGRIYNLLYYFGGAMVMFDKKITKQEYTINMDGEDLSGAYAGVNIANGPCYGGDKSVAVTAIPDDGFFDVLMFKRSGVLRGLTRALPYTGHDRLSGDITLKRGKIISIRSREPLMIALDGEAFLDTNITVELIKGGVRIAAPDNLPYKQRGEFYG